MPRPIHTNLAPPTMGHRVRIAHPSSWWPSLQMRQDEAFRRIWQALRQYDHVTHGIPDKAHWQDRAELFATCVIPVPDHTFIQEALEPLQAALANWSFIQLKRNDQLWIPIQELGFVVSSPTRSDETSLRHIDELARQASVAITDFPAFRTQLGGFNSFLDVPFLDVVDDGWCNRMHHRLRDFVPIQPNDAYAYLPHVPLGAYTTDAPLGDFPAQMAPWRDRRFGDFIARRLCIIGIHTASPDAAPELLHSFELGHERGPAQTIATPSQEYR